MPSKRKKTTSRDSKLDEIVLLSGRSNSKLAQKIAAILKKQVDLPITIFSDGEVRVRIAPNLRRRHVFIIQSTSTPVNDHIMELIFMIDAAKRASAKEIISVVPYFGYARQDRKEMSRVPISASAVANLIQYSGTDRIVTVDIHSEQQEGFVKCPWDNVYGSYSLLPAIKAKKIPNLLIASPDKGGVARATGYARLLGAKGIAIVYKDRDITLNNKSEALEIVGDVEGKNVLLVDDMIDTAGTLVNAANFLKKKGAKSVRAAATHGLFTGEALNRIKNSDIEEVIVTDTISHREDVLNDPKITVVSVAKLLAETIRRIQTGDSISHLIL